MYDTGHGTVTKQLCTMKYWKQGFYDQPVEGAVEITEGKWRRLLDGQARGMEIVEDENGMPVLREPQPEPIVLTYEQLVRQRIRERYSVDDELAILRQRDTKPGEVEAWFKYAEQCKDVARQTMAERPKTDNDVR